MRSTSGRMSLRAFSPVRTRERIDEIGRGRDERGLGAGHLGEGGELRVAREVDDGEGHVEHECRDASVERAPDETARMCDCGNHVLDNKRLRQPVYAADRQERRNRVCEFAVAMARSGLGRSTGMSRSSSTCASERPISSTYGRRARLPWHYQRSAFGGERSYCFEVAKPPFQ